MTGQGGDILAWPKDDDLCSATYPGNGPDFGLMCNEVLEHNGDHRALAEVWPGGRRYVVWTADGVQLPSVVEQETGAAPHDHDATDTFDPTCQRCRDGWQAAFDRAQCDYLEAEFAVGQFPPTEGDQMT